MMNLNTGGSRILKLGGRGALKKIAPSGGRRENVWGISCGKSQILRQKIIFFPFLVPPPPWNILIMYGIYKLFYCTDTTSCLDGAQLLKLFYFTTDGSCPPGDSCDMMVMVLVTNTD